MASPRIKHGLIYAGSFFFLLVLLSLFFPNSPVCPAPECPKAKCPTPECPLPICPTPHCPPQTTTKCPEVVLDSSHELAELGIVENTHSRHLQKPMDIMIVWKHNTRDKADFEKVYEVDPEELRTFHTFLVPSLRKCNICANWLFSALNLVQELDPPKDIDLLFNHQQMLSTQHFQKHVLGLSNLTLFTSIDDTVSFEFWQNLETFLDSKPSLENGKEYCIYPAGQHFVFPLEQKCIPLAEVWNPKIVLHLMIGILSKKYYSPMYMDHAEFITQTKYKCKPTPIAGDAYYLRRRKSHASLTHTTFYDTVLGKARNCTYDPDTGVFKYEAKN